MPSNQHVGHTILFAFLACVTYGCAAATADPSEADPVEEAPVIHVPASSASTHALGVVAWQVAMIDGAYSVAGFDDNWEIRAGMQTETQAGADGSLLTRVTVDVGDHHAVKRFATKAGQTGFERDEIAGSAEALHFLDLLGADLGAEAPRASGLQAAGLEPLDETQLVQPGRGYGFEAYQYEGCTGEDFCKKIIDQTNKDCHSVAYCSQNNNEPCGGSDAMCKADQAWVKNSGCDKKCDAKGCRAQAPQTGVLTCQTAPLVCPKATCGPEADNNCRKYGARCKNSTTTRPEIPNNSGYGI